MEPYKLYQSDLIKDNHQSFIKQCGKAYDIISTKTNSPDTTWNFDKYNIFSITSSSILFYKLYKELNYHIRSFIGDDRPLWLQSWLNYHKGNEVERELAPHSHEWDYHGYISIEPQNTTTIFHKGYEINNKVGQIYMGLGNGEGNIRPELTHYVKINKPYEGTRITIGFDVAIRPNQNSSKMVLLPLL